MADFFFAHYRHEDSVSDKNWVRFSGNSTNIKDFAQTEFGIDTTGKTEQQIFEEIASDSKFDFGRFNFTDQGQGSGDRENPNLANRYGSQAPAGAPRFQDSQADSNAGFSLRTFSNGFTGSNNNFRGTIRTFDINRPDLSLADNFILVSQHPKLQDGNIGLPDSGNRSFDNRTSRPSRFSGSGGSNAGSGGSNAGSDSNTGSDNSGSGGSNAGSGSGGSEVDLQPIVDAINEMKAALLPIADAITNIKSEPVDFAPIITAIEGIKPEPVDFAPIITAIADIKPPELTPVVEAIGSIDDLVEGVSDLQGAVEDQTLQLVTSFTENTKQGLETSIALREIGVRMDFDGIKADALVQSVAAGNGIPSGEELAAAVSNEYPDLPEARDLAIKEGACDVSKLHKGEL